MWRLYHREGPKEQVPLRGVASRVVPGAGGARGGVALGACARRGLGGSQWQAYSSRLGGLPRRGGGTACSPLYARVVDGDEDEFQARGAWRGAHLGPQRAALRQQRGQGRIRGDSLLL